MESVQQFCERVGISRRLFDKMKARGDVPALTRIGKRILIGPEASAAWLKAHEEQPAGKAVA